MKCRFVRTKPTIRYATLPAAFIILAAVRRHVNLGPSIGVHGFILPTRTGTGWGVGIPSFPRRSVLQVSTDHRTESRSSAFGDNDNESDQRLLQQVPKSKLEALCEQYHLSTQGTKEVLLQRLRDFADEQAACDHQRRLERKARVEEGTQQDSKERYEIVSIDPEEDLAEDDGYFFYHSPGVVNASATDDRRVDGPKPLYVSSDVISAPPPPPMTPDENGERVVTVYSTKDQNDLTGVAAAQPGQNMFSNDAMMAGSETASSAPWDMADAPVKAETTSRELEEAKETVTELVHALLAMTGAPAFREEYSGGLTPVEDAAETFELASPSTPDGFVGFDPAKVPTDILSASSKALRTGRGQVLQEVLRDYELRAIGHDGMAGDDAKKGGGHYREVSKVRAFLEGYRRAEVRRIARETATVLLDKLVTEGVDGLDFLLASMTKSSDDTGDAGELSNSLLDYLNDVIRQQEKRVESLGPEPDREEVTEEVDTTSQLWNVTTEKGQRIETLDPNDPAVQKALQAEFEMSQASGLERAKPSPKTGPEQLLLLLTLLRERIKAEATFSNDEKGRNLRMLAYCLHVNSEKEREAIIVKEIGQSIDRLDSFLELMASSIEYAESTTHQLQPSRTSPLNPVLLKSIHELVNDLREKQAWKASGLPPQT